MGEEIIIWVWPDHTWRFKNESAIPYNLSDDFIEIVVPKYVNVQQIDNWVKATRPRDPAEKEEDINLILTQYAVNICPSCDHLHESKRKISAVKCNVCGKLHLTAGHDYVAVSGNITIGVDRGLIGNNINASAQVKNVSTFCRSCFSDIIIIGTKEKESEPKKEPTAVISCPHGLHIGLNFDNCKHAGDCCKYHESAYDTCEKNSWDNDNEKKYKTKVEPAQPYGGI